MDSGKKKFDPRSIDEKAILDIVARKGTIRPDSPATSASPKPEDTVEEIAGSSEAPVFTTGEIDAYRASFLNTVRTKSRKSLHIDAGLHRRDRHRRMPLPRRDDEHRIDALLRQQRLEDLERVVQNWR